jgi:DNA (cytosine-5)-methyltransferase 1
MGWENKFHCEWNEFGQKVLHYYWPEAELFKDITKSDFTKYANKIDILTGGFPCQPYSSAGKRLGKEDSRHLWPEMLRVIREISPSWVVGENVRGLTNWNGGLVFDEVQADLEAIGYEVLPFLLPACAVNAPHRRDRIWFIAYFNNKRTSPRFDKVQKKNGEISKWDNDAKFSDTNDELNVKNTNGIRQKWGMYEGESKNANGKQLSKSNARNMSNSSWQNFPTEYPLCYGNDGISEKLDGITFSKWRNESIKAGGNAIVPQIAHMIFKAIAEFEKNNIS